VPACLNNVVPSFPSKDRKKKFSSRILISSLSDTVGWQASPGVYLAHKIYRKQCDDTISVELVHSLTLFVPFFIVPILETVFVTFLDGVAKVFKVFEGFYEGLQ
jgi:hypothetical protein